MEHLHLCYCKPWFPGVFHVDAPPSLPSLLCLQSMVVQLITSTWSRGSSRTCQRPPSSPPHQPATLWGRVTIHPPSCSRPPTCCLHSSSPPCCLEPALVLISKACKFDSKLFKLPLVCTLFLGRDSHLPQTLTEKLSFNKSNIKHNPKGANIQ